MFAAGDCSAVVKQCVHRSTSSVCGLHLHQQQVNSSLIVRHCINRQCCKFDCECFDEFKMFLLIYSEDVICLAFLLIAYFIVLIFIVSIVGFVVV